MRRRPPFKLPGPHRWEWRQHDRVTYHLVYGGVPIAEIAWGRSVRFEHLAMNRIVVGLNRPARTPPHTWWWKPGVPGARIAAVFVHNGEEMASLAWLPLDPPMVLRRADWWPVLMIEGLNRPGTHEDPVPEPAPPTWTRAIAV